MCFFWHAWCLLWHVFFVAFDVYHSFFFWGASLVSFEVLYRSLFSHDLCFFWHVWFVTFEVGLQVSFKVLYRSFLRCFIGLFWHVWYVFYEVCPLSFFTCIIGLIWGACQVFFTGYVGIIKTHACSCADLGSMYSCTWSVASASNVCTFFFWGGGSLKSVTSYVWIVVYMWMSHVTRVYCSVYVNESRHTCEL